MDKQTRLLEPQESFPKENWIQYARTLMVENERLDKRCQLLQGTCNQEEGLKMQAVQEWNRVEVENGVLKEQLRIAQEFNDALNDELSDCEASK